MKILNVSALFLFSLFAFSSRLEAQSTANSSSIQGTVTDPTGAVVPGATIEIQNPVSGFARSVTADGSGNFNIPNVPLNPYHLTVTSQNFATYAQDLEVRSTVPLSLKITLQLAGASTTVKVTAGTDLIETDPTAHTDIDRQLFSKLPLESSSSSLSSLVTQTSPGVAADSNGLFHGLGDHAQNSFSVDGQPITDQQSKVFSNQIPLDSVQSIQVIEGAPPAEYGDKTSLIINVTTRSGLGASTPHGSITADYGTFGTAAGAFDMAYGGPGWGNFVSLGGLRSGRFLDPSEFVVLDDKGNQENAFDRFDYRLNSADSLQLNAGFTRSWFENPNSYDATFASAWYGLVTDAGGIPARSPDVADCVIAACYEPVGATDQRSQIRTFNVAPTWTHLFGASAVYTLGAFVRHDQYNYYPSHDPFADLEPGGVQRQTVGQLRLLTNGGLRSDISYDKGIHNLKAGAVVEHTFVTERDQFAIVDPTFGAALGCEEAGTGAPLPNTPCAYDLTNGGSPYVFRGHADVKEESIYIQDSITKAGWTFNLGVRGDIYNGLSTAKQAEPRTGIAYSLKPTNTVLRVSYARTLETPFNENLVLSSIGCANPVLNPLLLCSSPNLTPLSPGSRNEFHAGFEQALGRYVVVEGEYIWKYTHNGYDFSVFGNTPITFPVEWARSKIPGFTSRVNVTNIRGFTAYVVMSSVAARFFAPQVGGAGAAPSAAGGVFRIDHDERFNQQTHLQYQFAKQGPWFGFNWRYDGGLVAGAVPFSDGGAVDLSRLTPDQEFQAGLFCGGSKATAPSPANRTGTAIVTGPNGCAPNLYGSSLISVPAPGTENDDKNPPRISARNLFDLSVGQDNLFKADRYKWSLRLTVINVANRYALYNFLSTFSGTHYVTPRTFTVELGLHF